jgi:cob(I)alamin adenosyltransferase
MTSRQHGLRKGYFQLYTGNGKGKTTAALGIAVRAMGQGFRTYIGQFMKGQVCGELKAAKSVLSPYVTVEQYGKRTLVGIKDDVGDDDIRMARAGLGKAKRAMFSGAYDVVTFDEIITAHHFHLVTLGEMLEVVEMKPVDIEVIFTGRHAPPEPIEKGDLVTEMKEVKHYYQTGVKARKGIER